MSAKDARGNAEAGIIISSVDFRPNHSLRAPIDFPREISPKITDENAVLDSNLV